MKFSYLYFLILLPLTHPNLVYAKEPKPLKSPQLSCADAEYYCGHCNEDGIPVFITSTAKLFTAPCHWKGIVCHSIQSYNELFREYCVDQKVKIYIDGTDKNEIVKANCIVPKTEGCTF